MTSSFLIFWFCTLNLIAIFLLFLLWKFLESQPIVLQTVSNLLYSDLALCLGIHVTLMNLVSYLFLAGYLRDYPNITVVLVFTLMFLELLCIVLSNEAGFSKLKDLDSAPIDEESQVIKYRLLAVSVVTLMVIILALTTNYPNFYFYLTSKPPMKDVTYSVRKVNLPLSFEI